MTQAVVIACVSRGVHLGADGRQGDDADDAGDREEDGGQFLVLGAVVDREDGLTAPGWLRAEGGSVMAARLWNSLCEGVKELSGARIGMV